MTSLDSRPGDTYEMPPDGWVCFHCGERFTTSGAASDHFGARLGDGLACKIKVGAERGLLMALRKAQSDYHEARCKIAELVTTTELCQRAREGHVAVPLETLMAVVDPDPCRFDHHGYCQAHGWLEEGDCPTAKLQALIAAAAKPGERPAP